MEKLESLKKSFESLEQQMAQGMSQQALEDAIKHVSQSLEFLQQMQQQLESLDAVKGARKVKNADNESPLK
jgi:exonuclease VII small subunit